LQQPGTQRNRETLFGILYFDADRRVSLDDLRRVAEVVGAPDAELNVDRNFGLGLFRHVVDPVGQQRAVWETPTLWLALTGELENHGQLRADLRRGGREAPTQDAALVAALVEANGLSAATSAVGFFNAVIWDRAGRDLVLLADRCAGVKAMYYCRRPGFLAFGSSLKAVLAHEDVPRKLDATSLDDVLVLGHPISPRTMVEDVRVLEAGTYLEAHGSAVTVKRYWQRRPWVDEGADLPTLERGYFEALQHAVARCAGDSEVCMMLSGGVDSAAVLSLVRRLGPWPIRTFSVHIGDAERSDRAASETVARMFGTDHRSIDDLDHRCLELLPEIIWHQEAPVVNSHPIFWLARAMRDECSVVLGGQGNDLPWGSMLPRLGTSTWPIRLCPPLSPARYLFARRRTSRRALRRLYPHAATTDVGLLRRVGRSHATTGDGLADFIALDEAMFGDQVVYRELGKTLVDAHGLWPRMPYTDAGVTRWVEAVPPSARFRRTGRRKAERKSFFKNVMQKEGVLPPELIYRRKAWMYSPTADWLRGPLYATISSLLQRSRLPERGLFDHARVGRLLEEHRAGRRDNSKVLMMLAAVELWHQLFVDVSAPGGTLTDYASSGRG
jgi:asparagine synthase (glutamine-hydrolysing)